MFIMSTLVILKIYHQAPHQVIHPVCYCRCCHSRVSSSLLAIPSGQVFLYFERYFAVNIINKLHDSYCCLHQFYVSKISFALSSYYGWQGTLVTKLKSKEIFKTFVFRSDKQSQMNRICGGTDEGQTMKTSEHQLLYTLTNCGICLEGTIAAGFRVLAPTSRHPL